MLVKVLLIFEAKKIKLTASHFKKLAREDTIDNKQVLTIYYTLVMIIFIIRSLN